MHRQYGGKWSHPRIHARRWQLKSLARQW
jgi:hypothetical protein